MMSRWVKIKKGGLFSQGRAHISIYQQLTHIPLRIERGLRNNEGTWFLEISVFATELLHF